MTTASIIYSTNEFSILIFNETIMGRAKIKKKSTFIDMTAMSDVTVLLLTFFMLTSTFVKKEPVQVTTPASVSAGQHSGFRIGN